MTARTILSAMAKDPTVVLFVNKPRTNVFEFVKRDTAAWEKNTYRPFFRQEEKTFFEGN
jgi:hypothetical protein